MDVRNEANIRSVLPVAIVGAALRFPGAADPASFHELTVAGRRTFRDLAGTVPRQRLGDPPRLAAETAAAALADVPSVIRAVAPDRVGAFVADTPEPGTFHAGHWVRERLSPAGAAVGNRTSPPGSKRAARFRQAIGDYSEASLHCSLRAVVAGCEALTAGEFDLAVAGGVSTGIGHGWAAGDVRVYDADPTGTLPGEGCGAVVLMRADDALAAGLPLYAEIVGWHAAGPAPGLPSLRQAYLRAGVDPADVQLVEGHGAATAAEDQAELSALLDLFGGRGSGARGHCALGAVSANIGDTRAAAGIAALLKTALAMTACVIPPATGCVRPHPLLQTDTAPLRLPAVPELWPETAVKLAAVNSLGTHPHPGAPRSGAVHVVLRRKPDSGHRAGRRRRPASAWPAAAPQGPAAGAWPAAPPRPTGAHVASPRAGTTVRSG
jgi:acyl transferase domain-containing protein